MTKTTNEINVMEKTEKQSDWIYVNSLHWLKQTGERSYVSFQIFNIEDETDSTYMYAVNEEHIDLGKVSEYELNTALYGRSFEDFEQFEVAALVADYKHYFAIQVIAESNALEDFQCFINRYELVTGLTQKYGLDGTQIYDAFQKEAEIENYY